VELDLLIAAQELRSGSALATSNESEFVRVPGLVVQDWTVET
jgi:predicted nucleic acid-binding protein